MPSIGWLVARHDTHLKPSATELNGLWDANPFQATLIGDTCMDMIRTAVVDITTLVATCHALRSVPTESVVVLQRKARNRLKRDLKRGAVAYIDALARSSGGAIDERLLYRCRAAAEQQMPHAVAHQELLRRIMSSEAGSLDGLAATRQDLWRLVHMANYLSSGMAILRGSPALVDIKAADALVRRLRRRYRKALIAYARVALRTKAQKGRLIDRAREAALAEIGAPGAAEAERLADLSAGGDEAHNVIRQGVTRPLMDLALDWHLEGTISPASQHAGGV